MAPLGWGAALNQNLIKNGRVPEGALGAEESAWERTPARAARPRRDPPRSVLHWPAAPAPGPQRARPFPRTLARLGPHLGGFLRTPDPQPRASPSPRFNYVIDFRFGRVETPLPPTGFNLSVPFLSLRALPPRGNSQAAPGPRPRPSHQRNGPPGPAAGAAAARRAGLCGCGAARPPPERSALHSSLRGAAAPSYRRPPGAGPGRAARGCRLPAPRRGCSEVCPGPAEAQRPAPGSAGSSSRVPVPRLGPAPAAQKRPEEQTWPQLSATARPSGTPGLGSEPPTCTWPFSLMSPPSPRQRPGAGSRRLGPAVQGHAAVPASEGLKVRPRKGERGEILIYEWNRFGVGSGRGRLEIKKRSPFSHRSLSCLQTHTQNQPSFPPQTAGVPLNVSSIYN